MAEDNSYTLSPLVTGLAGRCPCCGEGRLFDGFLTTVPRCAVCGLDHSDADSADGPAFFVMFAVGIVIVGGAFFVELAYRPAYWVHVALWVPAVVLLSLGLLRPMKGLMIALQYRHGAREGRLDEDGN